MLERNTPDRREPYADGLDLAQELLGEYREHDPSSLRAMARALEAAARSPLDLGCAAGFRIRAAEVEDAYRDLIDAAAATPDNVIPGRFSSWAERDGAA